MADSCRTLDIGEAVSEIKQACNESPAGKPFFLVIGAGVSVPSIPLSSDIVATCRAKAKELGRTALPNSPDAMSAYSHWFRAAYPQPRQRQEFLRGLIQGRPISPANLRLAHLLLSKQLTNLVVTPNFDDHLSSALQLFGCPHVVCDHPATTARVNPDSEDIHVVHVHGTYWFYDCCNLGGEIAQRSQPLSGTTASMAGLLDDILRMRSPIVIGYAGWEQDVLMRSLARRLTTPVPYNIYWFCFRREDASTVPQFIRDNEQVCLVLPKVLPTTLIPDNQGDQDLEQRTAGVPAAMPTDNRDSSTLRADYVLERLIESFGIPAPELTRDPLDFFAKQLRRSLTMSGESDPSLYSIESVIKRIEDAAAATTETAKSSQHDALEQVRDLMRRSKSREAVVTARKLNIGTLKPDELAEMSGAMWSAGSSLLDDSTEELLAYELAVRFADAYPSPGLSKLELTIAQALLFRGLTLSNVGRDEDAVKAYDEVVERFGESADTTILHQVATAMVNKGVRFGGLGRGEEAVKAYDEVVERFAKSSDTAILQQVATAIRNKGVCLGELGRVEDEIRTFDEVVERFGESTDTAILQQVAKAMVIKGVTLGKHSRAEDAVKTFDETVERFGGSTDTAILQQVAVAMVNKGVCLGKLGRAEDEIKTYDEVVGRFAKSSDTATLKQVAKAMVYKGITLGVLGRGEEALKVYDAVVERFAKSSDTAILQLVARAMVNKGLCLGELGRAEDEIRAYDEVVKRFGESTDAAILQQVAVAMRGKGLCLGELGRGDEAVKTFDQLVGKFGESNDAGILQQVASVLVSKGHRLSKIGRGDEAVKAYDEVVERFGNDTDPGVREQVATAKRLADQVRGPKKE